MNKTLSINISGFVFNIEEQAYEQLNNYLSEVRKNFHDQAEQDEIMDDIESRIAELFQEKISPIKEVIIETDINEVINILGHPEDFASDDEAADTNKNKQPENKATAIPNKQLFRDTDNSTLGGVCSGLGHYFNVDALIFRIIFIFFLLFIGTGFLLYIILWIVLPEAKSTSDKIEMKGQSVNVDSIKEHVSKIKHTITETGGKSKKKIKKSVNGAVEKSLVVGGTIFNKITKIIGVLFIIGGVFWSVILIMFLASDTSVIPFIGPDRIADLPTLIDLIYPGNNPSYFIYISIVFITIIPLLTLIITGIRLIMNKRKNMKKVAIIFSVIWTISIIALFAFTVPLVSDFKNSSEIRTNIKLENSTTDHLIIEVMNDDKFSNHVDPCDGWGVLELIKADDAFIYFGLTELNIVPSSDTGNFRISILKESRGATTRDAIHKIERINYPITTKNNTLLISPYLKIPRQDKIRGQYIAIEITVPIGKTIEFGQNIKRISRHLDGQSYFSNELVTGSSWTSGGDEFYKIGSGNRIGN